MICSFLNCPFPVENKETSLCARHGAEMRKAERDEIKNAGKQRKKIAKFSEKMKGQLNTYKELRKEYLSTHPYCFANLPGCTKKATTVHHLGGRGTKLNAVDTFMALCLNCHQVVHQKLSARKARELGLKQ